MKVAVVGAGPRGLLIASHLIYHFSQSSVKKLRIQIFDPYPIGGRVWKTTQPKLLIMNTIAQQMTMFDTQSFTGPNLYQWAKGQAIPYIESEDYLHKDTFINIAKDLGPNDYTPRCIFGVYLQWFYKEITTNLPKGLTIQFIQHSVKGLKKIDNGYELELGNHVQCDADKVVMNLGQQANKLTRDQQSLEDYAFKHDLTYYREGYAEDKDLSKIKPRQKVIIRGMGLNFVDYMTLLTVGRGGKFHNHDGRLNYIASGNEPRIIAGSIRGVPYYSKANNQKINGHHEPTHFLDEAHVKAHLNNRHLSYKVFIHLLRLDMELVYYTHLIKANYHNLDANKFKHAFLKSNDPDKVVKKYHFKKQDLVDWRKILNPVAGLKVTNLKDYRNAVIKWMNGVINDANLGNNTSSLASALEVVRDDRTPIRKLIAQNRFTDSEYVLRFLPIFYSISKFLSMGAPVVFMNQLRALMRARIITILGPRMHVIGAKGHFIAASEFYPKEYFKANTLIEAQLPKPRLTLSANPLLESLLQDGTLSRPTMKLANGQKYKINAANVKHGTDQVVNYRNKVQHNLYIWGLTTEGIYFNTANSPHPSGHDALLHAANRIARQMLGMKFKSYRLM